MSQVRLAQLALAAICATGLAMGSARADIITFTLDAPGPRTGDFTSLSSPDVVFQNTGGTGLQILDATALGVAGNGLATTQQDDSGIRMLFSGPMSAVSVTFGNDDAGYSLDGDKAWLVLFNLGASVATVSVDLNRNSLVDQTISYAGPFTFTQAELYYGAPSGAGNFDLEVISSLSFTRAPVSEPASLALLGAGLLGFGLVQQRRRSGSDAA